MEYYLIWLIYKYFNKVIVNVKSLYMIHSLIHSFILPFIPQVLLVPNSIFCYILKAIDKQFSALSTSLSHFLLYSVIPASSYFFHLKEIFS